MLLILGAVLMWSASPVEGQQTAFAARDLPRGAELVEEDIEYREGGSDTTASPVEPGWVTRRVITTGEELRASIGGILSIARTAIYANQTAIQTVSHNIANAHTEGYSRQRPTMGASTPVRLREGLVGSGVVVSDVARVRDGFLDLSVRRETANASGFGLRRDILQQVEGVFGEPSDTGLAASLDAFWSAWSDLATRPPRLRPGRPSASAETRWPARSMHTIGLWRIWRTRR